MRFDRGDNINALSPEALRQLTNAARSFEDDAATTGATVFVVSVDGSGNVKLDQQRAIVHTDPNDPNESRGLTGTNLVVLTATATDKDGDHAAAPLDLTSLLIFKDDGPSITATATGAPTLTVDETVLATNDTEAFAGQFTATFGADGQGATAVSYALSTPGGASGLTDTATGQAVVLSLWPGSGQDGDIRCHGIRGERRRQRQCDARSAARSRSHEPERS